MNDKWNQLLALIGKTIEAEDPSNLYQCMDAMFKWCDILGIPREAVRHFYAYQVFTQPNDTTRKYFDIIYNSPTNIPVRGDILVFGQQVGYAGHVSMATEESNSTNAVSLDQNWNGLKYLRKITHYNYYGVLGWLHPKTQLVNWDDKVNKMKNALNAGGTSQDRATNADKIFHE